MLGIDNELEQLYKKAQQDGKAVLKDRWTAGNYGCCSTRAPLVEKYRIEHTDTHSSLYLWGTKVVVVDHDKQTARVNEAYKASNYDKKIIDWFIQQARKS